MKSIEVWDSQGTKPENQDYLRHLLHYLHDEYRSTSHAPVDFPTWSRGWTTEDRSMDSPKQENSYDYGVFTIATMALLAQ